MPFVMEHGHLLKSMVVVVVVIEEVESCTQWGVNLFIVPPVEALNFISVLI